MRGKRASQRKVLLDSRYKNPLIARFINKIMQDGKKSVAEAIFYEAIESGAAEVKMDPVDFVNQVVNNIRPALEIRARRVGGANYSVPVPVSPKRQETLAIRWLVSITRSGTGSSFADLMKKELMDAFNNQGNAIKKKTDTEKMAEANKAFAHFKW